MNDFAVISLGMLAAIAPFGAIRPMKGYVDPPRPPGPAVLVGCSSAIALAILIGAAIAADPFLDFIKVSPESFQFAAGAVMAPFAIRLLWTGDSMPATAGDGGQLEPWVFPLAIPLLAGPAALTAVVSYSANHGENAAIAGTVAALAPSGLVLALSPGLRSLLRESGVNALGRLSGALLMIVAVGLAVDGVRSV